MANKYAIVGGKAGEVSQDPAEIDTNVTADTGATAVPFGASPAVGGTVTTPMHGPAGVNAILVIGTYVDDADGDIGTVSRFFAGHGSAQMPNEKLVALGQGGILPGGEQASGTLTIAEPVTDGDQFTIDAIEYTLLDTPVAAYDIDIGANEAATKVNIVAAINASGTEGTEYFAGTNEHPTVVATTFSGDDCVLTAKFGGLAGDSIATVESGQELTHASNVFDATTLGAVTAGIDFADVTSLEPIGISADVALVDQNA